MHELGELRADAESSFPIQPREFRVGAEARQERLQPTELVLAFFQEVRVRCRFEDELDLRSHRSERMANHQDVLVVVSGGSVTMRTAGAAARDDVLAASA